MYRRSFLITLALGAGMLCLPAHAFDAGPFGRVKCTLTATTDNYEFFVSNPSPAIRSGSQVYENVPMVCQITWTGEEGDPPTSVRILGILATTAEYIRGNTGSAKATANGVLGSDASASQATYTHVYDYDPRPFDQTVMLEPGGLYTLSTAALLDINISN